MIPPRVECNFPMHIHCSLQSATEKFEGLFHSRDEIFPFFNLCRRKQLKFSSEIESTNEIPLDDLQCSRKVFTML